MARGIEGNEIGTQKAKKLESSSSQKSATKQQSIAGFFQRRPGPSPSAVTPAKRHSDANDATDASKVPIITPARSSEPASSSPPIASRASQQSSVNDGKDKENGASLSMTWWKCGLTH